MHTGYFNAWPPRAPQSPGSNTTNVLIEPFGDMHHLPRSTTTSAASTPVSQHPPSSHSTHTTTTIQQQQSPHQSSRSDNHHRQPLSAPSSPRLDGHLSPPNFPTSPPTTTTTFTTNSNTNDKNPTTTTASSFLNKNSATTTMTPAFITPATTPTAPAFTSSPSSSSSPSIATAATTTTTTPALTPSKTTSRSSSPFVRKPRPLSTSFLNTDAFSFRKNSSNSTTTNSSFSSGFPLGSPSSTPPVAYPPHTVTSSSTFSFMAPPSRGAGGSGVASPAAAAHLSDSGSSSRGAPVASTHYFDPRPNYGPISAHSNNSTSSAASTATSNATATSNKDKKKKKQDKIRSSIYHQMGIGGLTHTPRSLPYSDFLLPQSSRLGPSATAPLPQAAAGVAIGTSSDQGQEWSTAGPLPSPSTSSSTFPSFQLRKSQSVGKSNGTKKGIKSPFKKLRKKQGSTSTSRDPHHALAFITSGESDSEAGNDNEQETTTFNARGMMSRFATGMSDNASNGSSSTATKSKPRHAAALFDTGLPQHPFRNLSFNYSHNSGGSGSTRGAAGVENGGTGEGQQQQQQKEPSAARFKDLFKNVGSGLGHHHSQSMSAAGSPTMHPTSSPSPSWDHYYPSVGGAGGAPVAGLMKSFQARGSLPRFGDFLSGDDQPSSAPRFRIPGPGRRKKKFSKKISSTGGYAPAATDDEDSPAPVRSATATMFSGSGGRQRHHTHQDEVGPQRHQNHHQHNRFLPHLHYRHRSRSFDEGSRRDVEITWRLPPTPARSEEGRSNISPALREAQRKNQDPGVILVELEPLPTRIVRDLAVIKSHHHQHHQQHSSSQSSSGPLNNFMAPSSTTASGSGSATSGPTTTHNNSQNSSYYNPQMMTPLLQLQLQEQQQQKQQHNEQPLVRSKADPAAIFCTKSFLFKSYQSSRFRGHYVFRVVGDQLEYKRLPNALEESCSQYFRKADVTYRSLERKAKAIREERDERKRNTTRSQSQPQLLHQQQQQHQLQHQNSLPLSAKLTRTKSQDMDELYGSSTPDRSMATLSSFLKEGGGLSQGDSGRFLGGGGSTDKRRSSGDDILKSAVAWDYYNPSFSSAPSTPMPAEVLSDSSISNSTIFTGRSSRSSRSSRGGGNSSYVNQRFNPENSKNNTLVRTFLGGSATGTDRILKSDPLVEMNPYAATAGIVSFQSPMTTTVMARPPMSRNRKRSWSSIKEERRRQEEEEENRFKESERKFREELEQAIYGLELYLAEILRGLEYERFDTAADVRVVNDNRDTAIFTLYNGDRTNIMSLESPSTKLKYEFINRIAISLMGREEAERDAFAETKPKDSGRHHFNSFLNMSTGTLRDRSEDGTEDADLLFDMIDIRLQQQEAKLRSMREDIQGTMNEIDSCLSQLDRIDERAKKMMTTMITAIDSQEIQLSLQPSPSTGKTLAETVEAKLRDVNERIVICTRIMGAARQNLNRLKYEIELEQRSIRLFRQYKIIIAVISGSIVFLVWFLYHARASALAPQPASPLFSTPPNPFEEIYNFHHGEPPILQSPASTLGFTSSKIVVAPSASTPTPSPHSAAFSSAEKDDCGENTADDSGARLDADGSGQRTCFQVDEETGRTINSKNESPFELLQQGHHLADLDLQDEFDATTSIPDHNEL